jgi:diguanylate cyclase (GGDEF)-like protein/PAS domain S-box-containing protein
VEPQKEFYKNLLDETYDGIYFVDLERRILYWNKGAERLTGFKRSDVVGKRCCDKILAHTDMRVRSMCELDCPLIGTMASGVGREAEMYLRHKDGHRLLTSVRTRPLTDSSGNVVGAVEIFRDRTHQEALAHRIGQLEELALLDPLTKLANRRHTEGTLETRLQEMSRYGGRFGVLFIDIDEFKEINDSYGHDSGDKVLSLSSQTISNSLRPFDFLGRWGGDEFVAIITNVNKEQLIEIADRARLLVENTRFNLNSNAIDVTVSIGAALAGRRDTIEGLLKRADKLMYQSKRSGRNKVSYIPDPAGER